MGVGFFRAPAVRKEKQVIPFVAALAVDLALAGVVIGAVLKHLRRRGSRLLPTFLFFLGSWYLLVFFYLLFLFSSFFIPERPHQDLLLFNSLFSIPLHGLLAYSFVELTWKALGMELPRGIRWVFPLPFLALLLLHGREVFARLAVSVPPDSIQLTAPSSQPLTFAVLLLSSAFALGSTRSASNGAFATGVRRFFGIFVAGLIVGFLINSGGFFFLDMWWQVASTSVAFAALPVVAWQSSRDFLFWPLIQAPEGLGGADLREIEEEAGITARESQVISQVITGKTNREISEELHISLDTVKKHLLNVYRKLNVRNRVELVNVARGSREQRERQSGIG